MSDYVNHLKEFCYHQLYNAYSGDIPSEIDKQLIEELGIIEKRNLGSIFYVLKECLDSFDMINIPHSTRGSCGNSLLLRTFGIGHRSLDEWKTYHEFYFGTDEKTISIDINVPNEVRIKIITELLNLVRMEISEEDISQSWMVRIRWRTDTLDSTVNKTSIRNDSEKSILEVEIDNGQDGETCPSSYICLYSNEDIERLWLLSSAGNEMGLPQHPEAYPQIFLFFQKKLDTLGLGSFENSFLLNYVLNLVAPSSHKEIEKIIGLTVGSGTYILNQAELLKDGTLTLKDTIACKEDIYDYLIFGEIPKDDAIRISENISRNKEISEKDKQLILHADIPGWFLSVVGKIEHLFFGSQIYDYAWQVLCLAYYKYFYPKEFDRVIQEREGLK